MNNARDKGQRCAALGAENLLRLSGYGRKAGVSQACGHPGSPPEGGRPTKLRGARVLFRLMTRKGLQTAADHP